MKIILAGLIAAISIAACSGMPTEHKPSKREDAANVNMQLGLAYLQRDELAFAKEKLERAGAQAPHNPNVHNALAMLYERLQKPKLADEHYRAALRYGPNDPDISNNYAIYLCRSGRTEQALKYFMAAARNPLYRTPESAYTNAGVCLRNAKRLDEAADNFRRAVQIRPSFAEASFQLGNLQLERGNSLAAKAQVDQYLTAYEPTPDLLLLGVRAAHALGDRLAAEKFAHRLRVEFPGAAQVREIPDLSRNPG